MPTNYIDTSALLDAIKAGLGNYVPGQPLPQGYERFLGDLLGFGDETVTKYLFGLGWRRDDLFPSKPTTLMQPGAVADSKAGRSS